MPIDEDRLTAIDWQGLEHAHGPADDLPDRLRALWSFDRWIRRETYEWLEEELHHQFSRYEASAPAVPFIIDVIADQYAPDRHLACELLSGLAVGEEGTWFSDPPDLDEVRREVARQAVMTVEELERDLADWVAAAPDPSDRRDRELIAECRDVLSVRDGERFNLESYEAVRAGVGVYLATLESPDAAVRLGAAHLLGWFGEDRAVIAPGLARMVTAEEFSEVVATAGIAAALLGGDDPALVAALSHRLNSLEPHVRWAAAIGLARVGGAADARVVRELFTCLREGAHTPVQRYGWGNMSFAAVVSLRHIPRDAVPDRLGPLLDVIARQSHGPVGPALTVTQLKTDFSHVMLLDGAPLGPPLRPLPSTVD